LVSASPGDRTELHSLAALVGRDAELHELAALVRTERLVTLTGPGGVGKSRLAWALVDRLRSTPPAVIVDLDPRGDSIGVAEAAARAIIGERYAATDPFAALETALGDRELLLVLDCFDHALREAADVVTLLTRCPGLRILVTSQRRLGVRGERVLPVAPLSVPTADADPWSSPAVQLLAGLLKRAGRHVSRGEGRHLAEISRRAAGVPLALELIAGWVAVYSPAQLAERLAASLELFTGGGPDLPDRHRDLRTLIRWSTEQLTAGEREVLTAVALLPGGADAALLADVCGRRVELDLRALVERHLVHDAGRASGRGEPWFDVLDPIRLHFSDDLDAESDDLRRRLVAIVAERVKALSPRIGYAGTADAIRRLTRLDPLFVPTVEALAARGDSSAVELALDLVPYWTHTVRFDAGARALTTVASLVLTDAQAARVLTARAELLRRQGDGQAAHDARLAAVRARRAAHDPSLAAHADIVLARALFSANARVEAVALLEGTADAVDTHDVDRVTAVEVGTALAGARFNAGDVAGAEDALRQTHRRLDDTVPLPLRLDAVALRLLVAMGHLDDTRAAADVWPARALLTQVEWPMIEAVRLRYWSAQHLLQGGHLAEAAAITSDIVGDAEATGVAQSISSACTMRAAVLALSGEGTAARPLVARAVEVELAAINPGTDLFGDLSEFARDLGLDDADVRHVVRTALRRPLPPDTWAIGLTAPRGFQVAVASSGLTPAEIDEVHGAPMTAAEVRSELEWLRGVLTSGPVPTPELSTREREVFDLVVCGLTDREIAGSLHVGLRTVHSHVASILRKTGCDGRRELIARHQVARTP
jgi:DNA-binding CsgD family transcriptional regulator